MRVSIRIALAALLGALCASGAAAQEQSAIDRLHIVFWPEFDRPNMLVIYRISLADTAELPATVTVPIPIEVGEPHAVAVSDAAGEPYTTPYTTQEAGEWLLITLEASTAEASVEYYAELEIEGNERRFSFDWPPGGLDIGEFSYEVQQPVGAEEPTIDPPADGSEVGLYGLTYHFASLGPLNAEATTRIQLSYVREQSGLSVDFIQQAPPLSRPDAIEGQTPDVGQVLTWLGAVLVGALLASGAFMAVRFWQARGESDSQRRKQRPRKRTHLKDHLDTATVFCHSCGRQAGASDHYCRSCGSQLRR